MSDLATIRASALAALVPPPRLRLSEWIETNLRLPEGVSSLPGRVELWPFQREIADVIGDPLVERVTLVKPVRVGFTTLLSASLAAHVANDPAPILALLPTEADCRDYMVSDLEPIFAATPALNGLLTADGDRNTLLSRRFPGGSLKVVAAKAPRNLRRHNVRVLLIDEADGMEVGHEGSPIRLAERRTLSFADRKIVLGSTPVFEATSHVLRAYGQSDARVFEVPCPECRGLTEILWQHIQWPEGRPEDAAFGCPHCGVLVPERHKPAMVSQGRWRATRPEVKGHAGFRLNALVSLLPNASWGRLAQEFVAAKGDPALLQTFANTILAEGWGDDGQEIDDSAIEARAEAIGLDALPEDVLLITAGADVQHDRIEVTFTGWGEDSTPIFLGHEIVWGAHDDAGLWSELDDLLTTRWPHPLGGSLGAEAVVVDAGDGATMGAVLAFCGPRAGRKVLAGKGVAGTRPMIEPSRSKTPGARLWLIGVDGIKTQLMNRVTRGGAVRFSRRLGTAWFEQLASERAVVRYVRGQPQRRFERVPGRRAEALDCAVYSIAARQAVQVNLAVRREELKAGWTGRAAARRPVIRSSWLGG